MYVHLVAIVLMPRESNIACMSSPSTFTTIPAVCQSSTEREKVIKTMVKTLDGFLQQEGKTWDKDPNDRYLLILVFKSILRSFHCESMSD